MFNSFLAHKKLMASRCTKCGALYLPPRAICPGSRDSELEWAEMRGEGKLAAYTAIAVAPTMMVQEGYGRTNPYCSGIVELAEGPKISARILGVDAKTPESIKVGTPMKVEFLERGEGDAKRYYLAFRAA
jgi:hypothetical protein